MLSTREADLDPASFSLPAIHEARLIAIHEAGHAVAFLSMGCSIGRVDIYKRLTDEGLVYGGTVQPQKGVMMGSREVVAALYAGPAAEARYRGCSIMACLAEAGSVDGSDQALIDHYLADLPDDGAREQRKKECESIATALVKEHWHQILSLANSLARHGHVIEPTLNALRRRAASSAGLQGGGSPGGHRSCSWSWCVPVR